MDLVLRIFGFVLLALLGFFTAHIVLISGLQLNLIDQLPPDDQLRNFRLTYFGGAGWACIIGTLIGLACFFNRGKIRAWLIPTIYCILALIYFSA